LILYSDKHYPSLLTQQFSGSVLRAKVKKSLLKVKIEKTSKLQLSPPVQLQDLNSSLASKTKTADEVLGVIFYLYIAWLGP
jgi:hypothetical protein